MKKQLCCLQVRNQQYCQKIIYSKKFDLILEKDKIKAELWYKEKQPCIVFYTFDMKQSKIKEIILKCLQYHLTIIKFIDVKSIYLVNCIMFGLFQAKIAPQIQAIQNQYDMEIQFNEDKCAIVIHDIDLVFQKEVKDQLLKCFEPLIFMSIQSKSIRNLSNLIKRKTETFSKLSTCFFKNTLYVCFNKNNIEQDSLKKIFSKFSEFVDL